MSQETASSRDPERADIVVYTQGWLTDQPAHDDDEPLAMLYSRVFINGEEVPRAVATTIKTSASFVEVVIELSPSTVKVIPLNESDWRAL